METKVRVMQEGTRAAYRERERGNAMSVGPCTMQVMRIRTLAGPPLPHEIARDALRAILLADTARADTGAATGDEFVADSAANDSRQR